MTPPDPCNQAPPEKRGLSLQEYHAGLSSERLAGMEAARPKAKQMIADYVVAKEKARQLDRELLMDAAAAEGHTVYFDEASGLSFYDSKHAGLVWDPLHRDGDALRLAVKLEIEIRNFNGSSHAGQQDKFWCTENWFPDGDPHAATRRAIVRAAARIHLSSPKV